MIRLLSVFSIILLLLFACNSGEKTNLPNIIIILADDMGYSDIGCFGSEIPTPAIDYLSENGYIMTQFYNAARCCPTRASLLTGLYPHQAGMGDMVEGRLKKDSTFLPAYQGWIKETTPTIAELLKKEGYQTFLSGKWHVGDQPDHWPGQRGFERSFSLINGASNYFNLQPWIHENQEIILTLDDVRIFPDDDFYMTTAIGDHSLEFISKRDKEKPFFLYMPFTAPHWPLHALSEDINQFEDSYMHGWSALRLERFNRMKKAGILGPDDCLTDPYFANPLLTPGWDTLSLESKKTWDKRMAVYAAQVYSLDREIGRVIDLLKKEKILENTMIMFLSDNGATQAAIYLARGWYADRSGEIGTANSFDSYGAHWANVSNTPFKLFKHWTAEGGIATPFIIHWPERIESAVNRSDYAHIIDILPTCLGAAGIDDVHADLPGISLLSLITNDTLSKNRPLFWEHQGSWAVRHGKWKLSFTKKINGKNINRLELFDLEADRSECDDLTDQFPDRVTKMKQMYERWAEEVGVEPWDSLILARNL